MNWDKLFVSNKSIHLQWKKYLRFTEKHRDIFLISLAMVNTDILNLYEITVLAKFHIGLEF